MTHIYAIFAFITIILILIIACGFIGEYVFDKVKIDCGNFFAGCIAFSLVMFVVEAIAFFSFLVTGDMHTFEAHYYSRLENHAIELCIKLGSAEDKQKVAYEKEYKKTLEKISFEEKVMSYKDWDAYNHMKAKEAKE